MRLFSLLLLVFSFHSAHAMGKVFFRNECVLQLLSQQEQQELMSKVYLIKEMYRIKNLVPTSIDKLADKFPHENPEFFIDYVLDGINEQKVRLQRILEKYNDLGPLRGAIETTISKLNDTLVYYEIKEKEDFLDDLTTAQRNRLGVTDAELNSSTLSIDTVGGVLGTANGVVAELWVAVFLPQFVGQGILVSQLLTERQMEILEKHIGQGWSRSDFTHALKLEIDEIYYDGSRWVEVKNISALKRGSGSERKLIERAKLLYRMFRVLNANGESITYEYLFLRATLHQETKADLAALGMKAIDAQSN